MRCSPPFLVPCCEGYHVAIAKGGCSVLPYLLNTLRLYLGTAVDGRPLSCSEERLVSCKLQNRLYVCSQAV